MTTLRGSCTAGPANSICLRRIHARTSVWLSGHPTVPVPLEVGAGLPLRLIESLWVVDLGFRIRPWTGDGSRKLRCADGGEAGAIDEIGEVQDDSHHKECRECRAAAEPTQPLGQLLGLRASRVVAIAEHAGG